LTSELIIKKLWVFDDFRSTDQSLQIKKSLIFINFLSRCVL
jgi:hypothetical protein